jgi:hypothetical protein
MTNMQANNMRKSKAKLMIEYDANSSSANVKIKHMTIITDT